MAGATNSALMRLKNEKTILSLINKKSVSRAEIAEITGLTKAAVTIITDDLKKRGIITEEKSSNASVGRNPIMLSINGDFLYVIGVNIKRYYVTVGISNLCGKVVIENTFPIETPQKTFSNIKNEVTRQLEASGISTGKIYKLAVAAPGPVKDGKILNPPNFRGWHNVSVVEELEKLFDFGVIFENVSSAAAVAEKYFGSAKQAGSFVVLQVDEGIGSGIIINDKLFKGSCEIGHISIKYDGEQCDCGNRGCLEKYASIPNILRNTMYNSWQECTDGNDDEIIDKEAQYLSTAIVTVNNIFSLEKAVLCGDLTYNSEKLISKVSKKISEKMLLKNNFEVCPGSVKSQALIAASIAVHDYFNI